MSPEQIKADLDRYWAAMIQNQWATCLAIEQRYGLEGYTPEIVTAALSAGAEGKDMDKAVDQALGEQP